MYTEHSRLVWPGVTFPLNVDNFLGDLIMSTLEPHQKAGVQLQSGHHTHSPVVRYMYSDEWGLYELYEFLLLRYTV